MVPGGTASLAVLGSDLPPSRAHEHHRSLDERVVSAAVRQVAGQNGAVQGWRAPG
jgi:hypothetical protein